MAKTHLSVSAKPELLNVPIGHTLPIREVRVQAGARQIVTLAGDINTLPGLPSHPNAWDIDLNDATGEITWDSEHLTSILHDPARSPRHWRPAVLRLAALHGRRGIQALNWVGL